LTLLLPFASLAHHLAKEAPLNPEPEPPLPAATRPPRPVVFSGIQPSGEIHVGNYLGAVVNWVHLIDQYDSIFSIVDLHALTVEYDPSLLPHRILASAAVNIAAGLDTERATLFVQSHVPEHAELAWYFNTVTPMGELGRMTQFKEKSEQFRQNVNVGLFDYPVLQAADILLYKAQLVPVGEDQVQHIELARDIARHWNRRYGEVFPEPQPLLSAAARVMGLDGKTKMSKSLGNHIPVLEEPAAIRSKLAVAVTDENRKRRSDPGNPDICNVFTMHKGFSTAEQVATIDRECRVAGIGCVDCKKILADNMVERLAPIREKSAELLARPDTLRDVLAAGAARCRAVAAATIDTVRRAMGLR
jgi:tryptophanyl-tRNA synthetase